MHQKRIIDDVLVLSRLESQMLSITPVAEHPGNVVEAAVRMFSPQAAASGTSLSVVKDPSFDALRADLVLCDRSRLVQILINLVGNAVKFTASSPNRKISLIYGAQAETPKVKTVFGDMMWLPVKDERQKNPLSPVNADPVWVYFLCQDSGPGLTPAEMDKLFQRFSQGLTKAHTSYDGSGLGLYICRLLTEKQGGQVGVASELGKGAIFGFFIKTSRVDPENESICHAGSLPDAPTDVNHEVKKAEGAISKLAMPMSPRQKQLAQHAFRVLLAEDNLVNQKVLAKQLKKAGCSVTVANNGLEALQILQKTDCWRDSNAAHNGDSSTSNANAIDVLVLDWEMPVMNGLECAAKIRELQRSGQITRHLPIVSITANIRQEQIQRALASGMDDVLPKPFVIAELLDKLRLVLKRKWQEVDDDRDSTMTG